MSNLTTQRVVLGLLHGMKLEHLSVTRTYVRPKYYGRTGGRTCRSYKSFFVTSLTSQWRHCYVTELSKWFLLLS